MTAITIDREVLEQALEVITANTVGAEDVEDAIRAALSAPATAPEQCWCDEQNIGEPGVSCGDCPTRDYKHPATAPVWHDAPTVPGLWVCREATTGNMQAFVVTDPDALNRNLGLEGRWCGPLPEDKP